MYRKDGTRVALLQVILPSGTASSYSTRVHRITSVFVAPTSYIIIHGFQYRQGQKYSEHASICVHFRQGDQETSWPFFYPVHCPSNFYLQAAQHLPTLIQTACESLLLLPTSQKSTIRHCIKEAHFTDMNFKHQGAKSDPDLILKLGFEQQDGVEFVTTRDMTTMRHIPSLSQNLLDTNHYNGLQHIFSANPASSAVMRIQVVSVNWKCPIEDGGTTEAVFSKSVSRDIPVTMEVKISCTVVNFNGCRSTLVH